MLQILHGRYFSARFYEHNILLLIAYRRLLQVFAWVDLIDNGNLGICLGIFIDTLYDLINVVYNHEDVNSISNLVWALVFGKLSFPVFYCTAKFCSQESSSIVALDQYWVGFSPFSRISNIKEICIICEMIRLAVKYGAVEIINVYKE